MHYWLAGLVLGAVIAANYFLNFPLIPLLSGVVIVALLWIFRRREQESERLKQEFVTVVTHKFRTPMTGIKWAMEMLHNNVTFQQKEDYLKEMDRAAERLREIIDLLTGFASVNNDSRRAYSFVSPRQLTEESLAKHGPLIRDKQLALETEIESDVPSLLTDKNKLQFVLDVLLDNAIKYTPAGGQIKVGLRREGNFVVLTVGDTGMGFSPSDRRRIFQRFWRGENAKLADPEGMGLGLFTARAIVRRLGGEMRAESPGLSQGAHFSAQIPITGYGFKFK